MLHHSTAGVARAVLIPLAQFEHVRSSPILGFPTQLPREIWELTASPPQFTIACFVAAMTGMCHDAKDINPEHGEFGVVSVATIRDGTGLSLRVVQTHLAALCQREFLFEYEGTYCWRGPYEYARQAAEARALQPPQPVWQSPKLNQLIKKYGAACLACGSTERLTIDHVVPRVKGGSHKLANLQPLCRSCNSRKYITSTDYRP